MNPIIKPRPNIAKTNMEIVFQPKAVEKGIFQHLAKASMAPRLGSIYR